VIESSSTSLGTRIDHSPAVLVINSGRVAPAKAETSTRVDSAEGTVQTIEQILANHTALQPRRELSVRYVIESIRTGLPILAIDMLVTGICLLTVSWGINVFKGHGFNPGIWNQLPAVLLLQWILFSLHQLYPSVGVSEVTEFRGIVRSTVLGLVCLSALNILFGQLPRIEFVTFAGTAIVVSLLLPIVRVKMRCWLSNFRWWGIHVLLDGRREDCLACFRYLLARPECGFIPVGYTSGLAPSDAAAIEDERLLGHRDDALDIACRVKTPVIAFVSSGERSDYQDRLLFQFPGVVWLGQIHEAKHNLDPSSLPEIDATHVNLPFLKFVPRLVKRATDLLVCIPMLLVLAVPMLVVAALIKFVSPGPVFYASHRIGQHGKPFKMWKFRTMVTDADEALKKKLAEDPAARDEWQRFQKLKEDPRVIGGIGRLMRRWSIDELPQLWNVLVGEMSLVGPRPVPQDEIVLYESNYYEYTQMWPGITGLWQVSGRNETNFDTRVCLVRHYAKHWSPWLDAWILLKTPPAVLSKRGAY